MRNGRKIVAVALCIAGVVTMHGTVKAAEVAGSKTPTPSASSGTVAPIFVVRNGQKPADPAPGTAAPTTATANLQKYDITTRVGKAFGVQLVCDKSGYTWKVVSISNPKVAKFTGSKFVVSTVVNERDIKSKNQKPTKISTKLENVDFKAFAKGTVKITVAYVSSKGTFSKGDKTATIYVTVK